MASWQDPDSEAIRQILTAHVIDNLKATAHASHSAYHAHARSCDQCNAAGGLALCQQGDKLLDIYMTAFSKFRKASRRVERAELRRVGR